MDPIWLDRDRVDHELQLVDYGSLTYDPDMGLYLHHDEPFTGTCAQRYPDGKLENIVQMTNGLNCGVTVIWYDSGRVNIYSELRDGVRHGKFIEWAEDGVIVKERVYDQGRLTNS